MLMLLLLLLLLAALGGGPRLEDWALRCILESRRQAKRKKKYKRYREKRKKKYDAVGEPARCLGLEILIVSQP